MGIEKPSPREIDLQNRGGLPPENHRDLNRINYPGGQESRAAKIAKLRKRYANDPVALQQIDVYEGSNEYHVKLREYIDALKSGDTSAQEELEAWFDQYYPDIKK